MIRKLFGRKRREPFLERTYKDMPGFSSPSVDDLRYQAIHFEKRVKDYVKTRCGELPTSNLHQLIHSHLPNYPMYPEFEDHWPQFVDEAKALKEYRNDIVHSNECEMPPVSELYDRFKKANETLLPYRICSASRERFKTISWRKNCLEIVIDQNTYTLSPADLKNLQIELHPLSRGKVHFIKGKIVTSKVLDYKYEKVTYFIEGFPEFELTHDESAVLEDLLSSLAGKYAYSN